MKQYQYDAIVVGSGAAGYAAADRLQQSGVKSLAMITEDRLSGTSRNTGSDKQTYYKLTLTGKEPDSVFEMAQTLFEGGAVDGDLALLEAAGSVRCFLHLVEEGVPFPANDYGEYVGYKTDHDPAKRATSAGPLTSRYMTECLEKKVLSAHIDYFDRHPLLRILAVDGQVEGLLCYSLESHEEVLFASRHIVYATGGPAGLYARSVYPGSQHGASGLAFEAGARGKNLTEWQYGIASTSFRWNLSGTYQQVLPRYLSTNAEGEDEREFLLDSMTAEEALARTFLKGYQWPFDPRKIEGSSRIDMLVYEETEIKGRRVFLDYTNNPTGLKDDFSNIGEEAYEYLSNSEALFGTPFDRLAKMNPRAIDLYRSHGIDLESERLEIAVCAQHNNGGLAADAHWESHVKGLYPVGEVCGSHGIYRPGGSALNAGQVGALRAAQAIRAALEKETPVPLSEEALHLAQELLDQLRSLKKGESNIARILKRIQARMSLNCA
ncbi:MAG: FAD-binding protein, partial [Clostridia bacterium]|nr:FAD-binding protein [Clostridia bacterium]